LAAPAAPRVAPVETRQQQRTDLPGKPANRVFRVDDKDKEIEKQKEKKDKDERRSQQKPDN
jgi:hypothetical protein